MYEFKGTPGPWEAFLRNDGDMLIIDPKSNQTLAVVYSWLEPGVVAPAQENSSLIEQSPDLLQKSQDLLTWLHVQHPEEGTIHCLACRNVTDPEEASLGKYNHHEECPVVPLAKAIFKALGVEE